MKIRRTQTALRCLDLLVVVLAAPIWVPTLLVVGASVVISSGTPTLFCQARVGRDDRLFSMRKFRSMRDGVNPLIPDPDCITPIGRFLRRTSLDELPQLLNVLDGSMSLVGPRPLLPSQQAALSELQKFRHSVRPGLTGLAQVSGRNTLSWDERFVFDLEWASAPSIRGYFAILGRTVRTVLSGSGVEGHDAADRVIATANSAVLDLDTISLPLDPPLEIGSNHVHSERPFAGSTERS